MTDACARTIRGYTLIEILVVIFIISIVSSVALLSIGRNENKQLEAVANELTQTMTLAEEQAMLQPMVLGLALRDHSFQFLSYQAGVGQQKNGWLPVTDQLLGQHAIPKNVDIKVKLAKKGDQPQVIISTNGDVTPFTIYVGEKGKKPRYEITGAADGTVTDRVVT